MTKIDFDADVVRTLTKQFLNEHSIPERGKVVYLTSVSSVSRGGHSIDFFKEFHPDNFVLCETVARVMRLNLTGIDVIAVDASQSWRDGGFFICEVNAKPQLGVSHMHIYKDFIAQKIKVTPYIKLVVSALSSSVNGLLDTSCDRMEIVISPESVLREGCPVQYFDELKISHLVSDEDRQKIEQMLVSVKPELSNNALA